LALLFFQVVFGLLEIIQGDQTNRTLLQSIIDILRDANEAIDRMILLRVL